MARDLVWIENLAVFSMTWKLKVQPPPLLLGQAPLSALHSEGSHCGMYPSAGVYSTKIETIETTGVQKPSRPRFGSSLSHMENFDLNLQVSGGN